MKRSWWRTGPPIKHTQPVAQLAGGQFLRQVALLVVLLLIWGGGFYMVVSATSSSGAAPVAKALPTSTPSPAPAFTLTPAATHTLSPAAAATHTATAEPTVTTPATVKPTPTVAADTPPPGNDAISFQRDVQPIFNQICVKCHGGEEVKEGLSLKSYADVMRGSDNGPIVVPGDPANSFLIEQIVKGEMPKRGPKLLPAQIRAITAWVEAGAPDN